MISYNYINNNKNKYIKFIFVLMSIVSCRNSNDIDSKIIKCYKTNDTIVSLSNLYPEKWDSVYFFGSCSFDVIQKRVGFVSNGLWQDYGMKMLILNKRSKVVAYKEWELVSDQEQTGVFFEVPDTTLIWAIPREKAIFLIKKVDKDSYILYYRGDEDL